MKIRPSPYIISFFFISYYSSKSFEPWILFSCIQVFCAKIKNINRQYLISSMSVVLPISHMIVRIPVHSTGFWVLYGIFDLWFMYKILFYFLIFIDFFIVSFVCGVGHLFSLCSLVGCAQYKGDDVVYKTFDENEYKKGSMVLEDSIHWYWLWRKIFYQCCCCFLPFYCISRTCLHTWMHHLFRIKISYSTVVWFRFLFIFLQLRRIRLWIFEHMIFYFVNEPKDQLLIFIILGPGI